MQTVGHTAEKGIEQGRKLLVGVSKSKLATNTATEFKPSANDREAFKDESQRTEADGGPSLTPTIIKSTRRGTKYRKQDGSN
jgi:hypothetical protein